MNKIALAICICVLIGSPLFAQPPNESIRIAVKEFPPFVFKDGRGFCIDMAKAICDRNGLIPEFVYYDSVQEVRTPSKAEIATSTFPVSPLPQNGKKESIFHTRFSTRV